MMTVTKIPTTTSRTNVLNDVVLIRLLLIILLVLYHAFAPYCGSWKPLIGQHDITAYWWVGKAAYSFMLPAFVFISGYVFGFQVRTKGDKMLCFKKIILGKLKRLILPSIIFSILYLLFFEDISTNVFTTFHQVLCGVGHMWFLPMLFWCFVWIFVIEKLKMPVKLILPLLILMSIFAVISIPYGIGYSMYYMSFFYAGYLIKKGNISLQPYFSRKCLVFTTLLFCALFVGGTLFINKILDGIMGGVLLQRS